MNLRWLRRLTGAVALLIVVNTAPFCIAQQAKASSIAFAPLDAWKTAIIRGDSAALKALYSTNPAARMDTPAGQVEADADINFWLGLKARTIVLRIVQSDTPQPGIQQIVLEAEVHTAAPKAQTVYITEGQLWQQQSGQWRLTAGKRTNPAQLEQPTSTKKDIYPAGADAHAEIHEALAEAAKTHKRVLVIFGANWCYDCHVLDLALHRPDVEPSLKRYYEVVHVDIGEGDKNQDLMKQYQVPMSKGIPGVAVLDSNGTLLYSQKNGEFEKARALAPADVLQFLDKWKPVAR
jgi:thioredoxin 1